MAQQKIAAEVMSVEPVVIARDGLISEAAEVMRRFGIRHLPVVDDDGRLIGVLSDRDLRLAGPEGVLVSAPPSLRLARVGSLMTPHGLTTRPTASLDEVAWIMIREQIGAVPVVDAERRVVGLISYVDLLAEAYPARPRVSLQSE